MFLFDFADKVSDKVHNCVVLRDRQAVLNAQREQEGQYSSGDYLLGHSQFGVSQRQLINACRNKYQLKISSSFTVVFNNVELAKG